MSTSATRRPRRSEQRIKLAHAVHALYTAAYTAAFIVTKAPAKGTTAKAEHRFPASERSHSGPVRRDERPEEDRRSALTGVAAGPDARCMRRTSLVLALGLVWAGLVAQPSLAQLPTYQELAAYGESITYDAKGNEQYLHILAIRSTSGVSIGADGYAQTPLTCEDGSTVDATTTFSGSGPGTMTLSGPLDQATVSASLDLTYEVLFGCPETAGETIVVPDQPVALVLHQVGSTLRTRSIARLRIPGERNDSYMERQEIHNAVGDITIGDITRPTTSAAIERAHTVSHGTIEAAGVLTTPRFFADLGAVSRSGSIILQARGGLFEQSSDEPAPGSVLSTYVDVTAETVDRTKTTVYALVVVDTVVRCDDGELGVMTEELYGSAPGTLSMGPRYRTAEAAASVPMTLAAFDGCDGSSSSSEPGTVPVALDLVGTAPVTTAADSWQFSAPPDVRGHERTVLTGRGSVSGVVRVGELEVAPTFGGIGEWRYKSQQVGTRE